MKNIAIALMVVLNFSCKENTPETVQETQLIKKI